MPFGSVKVKKIVGGLGRTPLIPLIILPIFVVCGLFGDFIAPKDPIDQTLEAARTGPVWTEEGSFEYPLGTDAYGRDILSRIISGARISLWAGLAVVFLGGGVGYILALLAGFLGGWVDTLIMRLADAFLSMPYLMICIVLAAILGPGIGNIIVVLVVFGWARYTRVLRGEVLRVKEGDFIKLATVTGCSNMRIMLQHILPNIMNTFIVLATINLGQVIIMESILSFLGVGVPPPIPAWGSMCADGRLYIASAWWISAWPGLAILLVVLSFNLLGDWLRVRLDPKFRQI